ncbi:hypothetical protein [Aurantiacibacter sp. D1-12]|uniref:hypothetical protein n=1 Tax=Aurantiacibacter sp. D1-12 TaxID=2993658 RepID=UPI00237CE2ED|nr:hypothetical protein [Aurantiacibacter sp. D1-12]MDE1467731.1 hypothetical protein [Aurantiacibacter sp. D1-12]
MIKIQTVKEWCGTILMSAFSGSLIVALLYVAALFTGGMALGAELQPRILGEIYILTIVLLVGYGMLCAVPILAILGIPATLLLRRYVRKWWFFVAAALAGGTMGALVSVPLSAIALSDPIYWDLFNAGFLGGPIGVSIGLSWAWFAGQVVENARYSGA